MVSRPRRHGDLEIDQDPRFQERVWAWQRAMWGAFAAVLAASALGLFGGGLFGAISRSDPERRLRVAADRFGRWESRTDLEIEYRAGPRGESRIWLGREYLDSAGVEGVDPTPLREVADPSGTTYVMAASPGGGACRVRFRLKPTRMGFLHGVARLDDGSEVAFTQFVHP